MSGGLRCSEHISGTLRSDRRVLTVTGVGSTVTCAHSGFPSGQSIKTTESMKMNLLRQVQVQNTHRRAAPAVADLTVLSALSLAALCEDRGLATPV